MARTFGVAFERERRGVSRQGRAKYSLLADVFIYILSCQVKNRAGFKNLKTLRSVHQNQNDFDDWVVLSRKCVFC